MNALVKVPLEYETPVFATADDLIRHYSSVRRRLDHGSYREAPVRLNDESVDWQALFWFMSLRCAVGMINAQSVRSKAWAAQCKYKLAEKCRKNGIGIGGADGRPGVGRLTIRQIQHEVCYHYDVSYLDLISHRRTASVVLPRQIACWLAKNVTGHSYPEIGRRTGGRDHTTAMYAVRKVDHLINNRPEFRFRVLALKSHIESKYRGEAYASEAET